MEKKLLLALSALLLAGLAGCLRQPKAPASGDGASVCEAAVSEMAPVEAVRAVDSLFFEADCAEYTCYFAAGALDRAALETARRILFESPVCNLRLDERIAFKRADELLSRARDSLTTLAWPEGEPWPEVRALFEAWAVQQLERDRIVGFAHRDPELLLRCPERDSMLVRCAAIIRSGPDYVAQVRSLWHEAGIRTAEPIERELAGADSLSCARKRLLQLLGNHLNRKIHRRLGEEGTVDFGRYTDDFFRLFDSVRVESWEP